MITQADHAGDAPTPDPLGADCTGSLLTSRECEVLQLVTDGMGNRQTASTLHISVKTVEKHRAHIMEKLDIHDIAGLTRFVLTSGIFAADALPNGMSPPPEARPVPAPLPGPPASIASTVRQRDPMAMDRSRTPERTPASPAMVSPSGRLIARTAVAVGPIGTPDDRHSYHRRLP